MITVQEATRIVLDNTQDFGVSTVPLQRANGRVLKEELIADRDFPPFNRVTMDGIAIAFDAFEAGIRAFKIQGLQSAGSPQQTLGKINQCIEAMTGAMLPVNTDTVIRYEDLEIKDGVAHVIIEEIRRRQNVHRKGFDRKANSVLLKGNRLIAAPEIGVAATIGKHDIKVANLPKVVIVSTGDELVGVDQKPLPYQIRSSNVHKISSVLERWKIDADLLHIVDDPEATEARLADCLEAYDVIILSGGVSKGKLDYVPTALKNLGAIQLFHRVRQRPGKPFWFGKVVDKSTIFALPGNPVSSFMCLNRYFLPWLRKSLGLEAFATPFAALTADIDFKPDLTYFAQVKVTSNAEGKLTAHPVEGHGSGDLANLVDANAFMELPRGKNRYAQGEVFSIMYY